MHNDYFSIDMESIRSAFTTQDGTKIFSQFWRPAHHAKAVVVQVHGLGEHSGRYDHVAKFFGSSDIAFYGFDHRGHGRSDGKRGHIPNYESLMEEVDLALLDAEKHFPLIPKILYGHSWGGNITLNYLLRRQSNVLCAIVTGPWLHIPKVPAFEEMMAQFMNAIFPSLTQNNKIDASKLSKDPAVVSAYVNDPLVHPMISVRLFVDSDAAAKFALANAEKVKIPLLLMHGKEDLVTLATGSQEFEKGLVSKHQFALWDGMVHEIHNEPGKAEVLDTMLQFIQAELPA
jgi:alpha-beta hydrolase superfamily lysophospholipase